MTAHLPNIFYLLLSASFGGSWLFVYSVFDLINGAAVSRPAVGSRLVIGATCAVLVLLLGLAQYMVLSSVARSYSAVLTPTIYPWALGTWLALSLLCQLPVRGKSGNRRDRSSNISEALAAQYVIILRARSGALLANLLSMFLFFSCFCAFIGFLSSAVFEKQLAQVSVVVTYPLSIVLISLLILFYSALSFSPLLILSYWRRRANSNNDRR